MDRHGNSARRILRSSRFGQDHRCERHQYLSNHRGEDSGNLGQHGPTWRSGATRLDRRLEGLSSCIHAGSPTLSTRLRNRPSLRISSHLGSRLSQTSQWDRSTYAASSADNAASQSPMPAWTTATAYSEAYRPLADSAPNSARTARASAKRPVLPYKYPQTAI